jgi:serine/threonine protein kinase
LEGVDEKQQPAMSHPENREETIFFAALQFPAEQVANHLDQACGPDVKLRERVEALLKVYQRAGTFLEKPAQAPGPATALQPVPDQDPKATVRLSLPPTEKPGDRIGRYKLLQQIGEGGCGVVYMAEQQEPVKRRVALKVIKLGMDTKQVVGRFEAERQALALMDHRDAGRPFFVMELVRGIKITDYCDQNNLSTSQRLELFIQVCHAIQHAHQKGVIHRDIKPSNILVTMHDGVPQPKVIDFGIAKATDQRLTDKTLFTAFEQFMGTPAYMSPEQAEMSALDIDTRTDIYSLGVLLYELLTGKTPFDPKELAQSGLDAMRRTIREKEPARPSTRLSTMMQADLMAAARHRQVEPEKLTRMLCGDLDWIAMKALEKDRTRRYETANGLAMDVRRYLQDELVVARPPSRLYRLQKTIRRNKAAFVVGMTIFLALLVGLSVSTLSFVREKKARERALAAAPAAEIEANKREQMAKFLQDMLARVSSQVAEARDTRILKQVLGQTMDRFGAELKDQPAVEAELRTALGNIYSDLGDYTSASTMYEAALRLKGLAGEKDTKAIAEISDQLGNALAGRNDLDEAAVVLTNVLTLEKKLFGETSSQYADPLSDLGLVSWHRGDLASAEKFTRSALELKRKLPGKKEDLASTIGNLGPILWEQGRFSEAEPYLNDGLNMMKTLLSNHPDLASFYNNLALNSRDQGHFDEAENNLRETLRLLPDKHPYEILARSHLAGVIRRRASLTGASDLLREAFQVSPADVLTADALAAVHAGPTLVPVSVSGNWRVTSDPPAPNWASYDFSDLSWQLSTTVAGFPTYAPCSPRIDRSVYFHTNLWLRREFDLPGPAAGKLVLRLNRCHDAEVFINGSRVAPAADWTDIAVIVPCFENGRPILKAGRNLLAVHCLDADGGTTVNVGIYLTDDPSLGRNQLLAEFGQLIQKAPERAELYVGRANVHARLAGWKDTAADLNRALALDPEAIDSWCELAPILLETGETRAYDRHRQAALMRFADPKSPSIAAQVVELSLLRPLEGTDLASVAKLADWAATAQYPDKGLVQRQLAKGLSEYRQKHFANAIEWMDKVHESAARRDLTGWTHERERNRTVTAWLIQALAHHQLMSSEAARVELAKAHGLVVQQFPQAHSGDTGREWPDWLVVQIFMREAEAALDSSSTEVRPGSDKQGAALKL